MASVKSSTRIRIRVILLSLLPVFLVIMLVTLFLASSFHLSLSRQNMKFGNTMADQIALTSTEYLINQDSVSLNVILRDLLSSAYFEFAAIYDADGSLITQAGKSASTQTTFTRDITSQNTVVGHLSLGLTTKHFPTGRIIIAAMLNFHDTRYHYRADYLVLRQYPVPLDNGNFTREKTRASCLDHAFRWCTECRHLLAHHQAGA